MQPMDDKAVRYIHLRVRGCSRTIFTILDILLLAAIDTGEVPRIASYAEIAEEIGCYPKHVRTIGIRLERAGLLDIAESWREDGGRDANAWLITDVGRSVLSAWPDGAGADAAGELPEWARSHVGGGALASIG